jgi:hypothetical protein
MVDCYFSTFDYDRMSMPLFWDDRGSTHQVLSNALRCCVCVLCVYLYFGTIGVTHTRCYVMLCVMLCDAMCYAMPLFWDDRGSTHQVLCGAVRVLCDAICPCLCSGTIEGASTRCYVMLGGAM